MPVQWAFNPKIGPRFFSFFLRHLFLLMANFVFHHIAFSLFLFSFFEDF
ncbi:hypothetical protein RMSM_01964 [Rhodopirellula maiorica SM1]|uniref:Uncharacterized protein n=1 Tax=Rhodopirellula maiorica SM1 TaxID=1265738 RepID=M5RP48_9BACT|nr:hypothetical protein RMSM_01964 [Rhodopirellula maiorica SM1]